MKKLLLKNLIQNYKFNPTSIKIDCYIAQIKSIRKNIQCKNTICYYHTLKRLVRHLSEIISKNDSIKTKAKYLINNIKILLFIQKDKAKYFFDLIKNVCKFFQKISNEIFRLKL